MIISVNFILRTKTNAPLNMRYFLFAAVFFNPLFASAQIINIDKTDTSAYQNRTVWRGKVTMGLVVDKEKETLVNGSNFVDLSLQKSREFFIISSSERFNYDGSTSFLNTGYAHLRWRHDYKDKLHEESFLQFQWDANRGMVHRYVAGGNLRYNLWHRRAWEMTVATGFFYENELWDYSAVDSAKIPPGATSQTAIKIRSNTYIKWEGSPTPTSHLAAILFYQVPVNDMAAPRISANVNFTTDVSKHFSFGLLFNCIYDAKPVVPIFNFYYSLANSLVYKF